MSAKKGTNRFAEFQTLKQASRERLIAEFLAYLKTSRVRHQYVTELAEMVANHISKKEEKPCNKSTFLRNPRYKSMLLSFMAENLAAGTKNLKTKNIDDPKAQALMMTVQLESSNFRRDNERLRSYVMQLEAQVEKTDNKSAALPNNKPTSAITDLQFKLEQERIRFARVCQALQLVIRHLDSLVSVDMSARHIIDMTKSRNNVIVNSEIASGFFEWLDANQGIG